MFLVTGATGNVGRHVVSFLLESGAAVRALSRDPAKAQLPAGVEIVRGDLSDHATLPQALDKAEGVFLFGAPGSETVFTEAAKAHGVQRVVFLSSLAVRDDVAEQEDPIAAHHAGFERVLEESGLEWTFVRPGAFAANTLGWAAQIRAGDAVRIPYGGACVAPVHERDIAAVAAHALLRDDLVGARLALTGPESMTQADQVRIIGEAIGRELRHEELPAEVAREEMARHAPAPIVNALLSIWAASVGVPAQVLPTVEEITGRPALTFRQWAGEHTADFR